MSELSFTSRYERLRQKVVAGLMGRVALSSEPMVDEQLIIQFRKTPIDMVTGDVIREDWNPTYDNKYLSSEEAREYTQANQEWSIDEKYDDGVAAWLSRETPIPVIVDEYGVETIYEPTKEQIKELCETSSESSLIIGMQSADYFYNLAKEGQMVIDNPRNRDEKTIAKLFASDLDAIRSSIKDPKISSRWANEYQLSNLVFKSYHAEEPNVVVNNGSDV